MKEARGNEHQHQHEDERRDPERRRDLALERNRRQRDRAPLCQNAQQVPAQFLPIRLVMIPFNHEQRILGQVSLDGKRITAIGLACGLRDHFAGPAIHQPDRGALQGRVLGIQHPADEELVSRGRLRGPHRILPASSCEEGE